MRPKLKYDEVEVEEIIKMKLDELGGLANKLTFNNVKILNDKIANNPEYKRADGSLYRNYGYTFWVSKGYYGYETILKKKENNEFKLAGESFLPEMKDILVLTEKFHKKPSVLSSRLIKLFEEDRKKIKHLTEQNNQLMEALKEAKDELEQFKAGFASVFFNSANEHNSLEDVLTLTKSDDSTIRDELKNMFNDDIDLLGNKNNVTPFPQKANDNILIDVQSIMEENLKELDDEGF